jgi:hypothetical protein
METAEKLCYACAELATTREHSPPYSFFPAGNNANLMTVPSCELHNNANSKDVEYARNIITTMLGVNHTGESHFLGKAMRSFERSPKLLNATFGDIRPVQINGGTSGLFTVNVERVEAVMEACVRAIHFAETSERCGDWKIVVPNFMYKEGVPEITVNGWMQLLSMLGSLPYSFRTTSNPDVFEYGMAEIAGGYVYALRFYKAFHVYAFAQATGQDQTSVNV